MKLSQLLTIYPKLRWGEFPHTEVKGLTQDSRKAEAGWVFVAIRGTQLDGHQFIPQVCDKKVAAVVVEDDANVPENYKGAVVVVKDSRTALDKLAVHLYGHPSEKLFCVGVTGTNGKTSITYMIEAVLNQYGWATGVMGTINHHLGSRIWETDLTTPDAITLQKRLSEFCALKAQAMAAEVSSIALTQNRADSLAFDVAIFTNLTRDHLDFHGTMEEYFFAKEKLFNELLARSSKAPVWAILNGDDSYSSKFKVADRAQVWTYGQNPSHDFSFSIKEQNFTGTSFTLRTSRGEQNAWLPMPGLHNVYNAVAAIATGVAAGASLELGVTAMASFNGVPGRLQRVAIKKPLHVFVDYAHTDDALRVVLQALREIRRAAHSSAKILVVFGCGGDRDRGKRPLMAKAAVEGADLVMVTSDNPRTEAPDEIINDCIRDLPPNLLNQKVFIEVERRIAIGRMLQMAQDGDVILIAGKGHETYQIIGKEKRHFSDIEVVEEWDRRQP